MRVACSLLPSYRLPARARWDTRSLTPRCGCPAPAPAPAPAPGPIARADGTLTAKNIMLRNALASTNRQIITTDNCLRDRTLRSILIQRSVDGGRACCSGIVYGSGTRVQGPYRYLVLRVRARRIAYFNHELLIAPYSPPTRLGNWVQADLNSSWKPRYFVAQHRCSPRSNFIQSECCTSAARSATGTLPVGTGCDHRHLPRLVAEVGGRRPGAEHAAAWRGAGGGPARGKVADRSRGFRR